MAALKRRALLAAGVALPGSARGQVVPSDQSVAPATFFNPSNERIAEAFAAIAFGGDAETGAPARDRLLRFRTPMRIAALGEDAARYAPWIAAHARNLSRATGQAVGLATQAEANVIVLLTRDAPRFLRDSGQRTALARMFGGEAALDGFIGAIAPSNGGLFTPAFAPGRPHDIAGGLVLIPTGADPATVYGAIVEELSQLLGLLGDDDRVGWSIFNDASPYVDLTDPDRWMLRLLYDRAIRPGMTRPEALRAATEAMRRLRPDGIIAGPVMPDFDVPDEQVVEGLLSLAFANGRTRLVRRDEPIRVRVVTDEAAAPYRFWAGAMIGQLAFVTRHAIEAAETRANLVIAIARDPEAMRARFDPGATVVAVRGDASPTRVWAELVAWTSRLPGQFGTNDALEASSFRTSLPYMDLTTLDQRMLRLLYLSGLRPGMTLADAREGARRVAGLSRIAP